MKKIFILLTLSLFFNLQNRAQAQSDKPLELDSPAPKAVKKTPPPAQKPASPAINKNKPAAKSTPLPAQKMVNKAPQKQIVKSVGKTKSLAPVQKNTQAPTLSKKQLPSPPAAAPTPAPALQLTPPQPELTLTPTKTMAPSKIPPLSEDEKNTPVSLSSISQSSEPRSKYKNRRALTVDYNTWYEMLKLLNKTPKTYSDAKSHYFGIGISFDYTVYNENYGYAVTLGGITGNAQAGTQGTGEYYERRISWYGLRGGGRLFFRANSRVDIGPALLVQTKQTKWPEETEYQVQSQANPQYFIYLDTRWRVSYPLELIQSFGAHTRQQALVWRLGLNYTLN